MSKSMNEYDSIRNEIISMQEQERNVWIYMYVIFVALFVLGIEFSYNLFLVTYVILIPFQVVINRYQWSILKMSTYIQVFFEKEYNGLNWENMHVFDGYKKYHKKINGSIAGIIRNTGVSQLGFLASAFYISNVLYTKFHNNIMNLSVMEMVLIILSICLFFLTVILNREYNKNYREELADVIKEYSEGLNRYKSS